MVKKSLFIVRLNRVDLLTLSSVFTSFLAILVADQGHLYFAMSLLFVAMIADALDGIFARKWGLEREFGRYLDSFMDVLIYLVAPTVIMLHWGFNGYLSIFILMMIASGCIRLAVFNQVGNISVDNKASYLGMPVFWSIFILAFSMLCEKFVGLTAAHTILAVLLTGFSVCMLVNKAFYKFSSLKQILTLTLGGGLLFIGLELTYFGLQSPVKTLLLALYLQIPVVIGGVLHMLVIRKQLFNRLAFAIDQSRFGNNKTWRGMICVPLFTALGGACLYPLEWLSIHIFDGGLLSASRLPLSYLLLLGFMAGLGYVIAELPNSYIKRRLGISAGEVPQRNKYWFIAFDQLDSALGVALVYWLFFGFSTEVFGAYVLSFPITALLVKRWLFHRNMKLSPT